jgi:hypothetical protein
LESLSFSLRHTTADPVEGEKDAAFFQSRLSQLRELLSLSAIVLIVGMLQVNAEFRWPASVVKDVVASPATGKTTTEKSGDGVTKPSHSVAESLSKYASSYAITVGGWSALVLLVVFGASLLVLNAKAISAAKNAGLPLDQWRQENGVVFSWNDVSLDFLKIIGPILTALVSNYLK